ncbi:PAP2 superfamily protein [Purpureocillium lavendulum]|uniref:PAP2 superfamily protein n=1 Tax=Purpureocillium lavendulum TaxID=1247861 RepID=A0AB34FRU0_9HYPO|nr:PAP2 superfamily protein [Purpureocillium lavendulum]
MSAFNNLSVAMQSKQLERRTADAALKRAMVGREEAEAEIRRLKEDARLLQKAVQEGKERERRVGERLETVMENYGRAKETHAHTQALWEKEIRRARKENFKTQSSVVKTQEDLKSARSAVRILEENLEREKERSRAREQEAFNARYQIVGVQEQLEQALERIKLVEQERDAFKTAAKNEEVARIAAEGRLPLPKTEDPTDEFASPKKTTIRYTAGKEPRVSLSTMDIVSSAASEIEIEELTTQVLWERQRADRAQEMVEFLQAECQMHCCPCSKSSSSKRPSSCSPPQKRRRESVESPEPHEHAPEQPVRESPQAVPSPPHIEEPEPEPRRVKSKKEPRRSTIFCPREGIFRTVSEQEAEAMEAEREEEQPAEEDHASQELDTNTLDPMDVETNPRMYARTPSVDPPTFALLSQNRTSLQSLLNAPHGGDSHTDSLPSIRSVPVVEDNETAPAPEHGILQRDSPEPRPHTSATIYTVTTQVPVRDENASSTSSFSDRLRTPSGGSNASFDHTNPALTPTMTREQALAKIRERRGRVRSAAQAAATPRKASKGTDRRDVSAPTGKGVGRRVDLDGDEHALERALATGARLDAQPPLAGPDGPRLGTVVVPRRAPPALARMLRLAVATATTTLATDGCGGSSVGAGIVRLSVERDGGLGLEGDTDAVLAQGRVARGGGLGAGAAGAHEQAERLRRRRQVELGGHHLEQLGDAGTRVAEELGTRRFAAARGGDVQTRVVATNLEDEFVGGAVDERPHVVDPEEVLLAAASQVTAAAVVFGAILDDADAALLDVLEAQDNLLALAQRIVADVVGDELLLEALEVEVAGVAEQLLAVRLVAYLERVSLQQMQQLGEDVGRAVGHRGRQDGGRADEPLAVEPGEHLVRVREEGGEAKREVVGAVGAGEQEGPRYLELAVANGGKDALIVELRY